MPGPLCSPAANLAGAAPAGWRERLLPGRSVLLLLLALAPYWLLLIYGLGAQWSIYEQYNYGWAVPFLCGVLIWRRYHDHRPLTTDCPPRPLSISAFQYFSFALLCLLYAATRVLHEANPIWRLTSWLWALDVVALTLLLLSQFRISGFQRFSFSAFPLFFFLLAVPWPSALETALTQWFKQLDVSATTEVLGLFGIPAVQHGNVIELASGIVGIDEACSGIRSFQATLMISLFLGEFYYLTLPRRALWLLVGVTLAFLFNVARTFLLVWVASSKGIAAVHSWHDPAGTTILVACFLSLWAMAAFFSRKQHRAQPSPNLQPSTFNLQPHGGRPLAPPLFPLPSALSTASHSALCTALVAWFLLVETGTELWYRSHETHPARISWSINPAQAHATQVPIAANILNQFNADQSLEARWQNPPGYQWQLYYFRWFPGHSLKQRVAIQLAKTHGPEKCLVRAGMTLNSDLGLVTVTAADIHFAFQQYLFSVDGRPLHVFYALYEDVTGTTQLANRRQTFANRIASALAGSRNYGQRFLELALSGPADPEAAKAELQRELAKIVTIELITDH